MSFHSPVWMILTLGLCVAGSGCGGGSKSPAPNPAAAPAPNVPQHNPAPPAPMQVAAKGASSQQNTAGEEETEPVPPSPDDFEINPDQIVTEVAGEFQEAPPTPVEVVALEPGLDSSTLQIAAVEDAETPNAPVNTPNPHATPDPVRPAANDAETKSARTASKVGGAASKAGGTKEKDTDKQDAPEPTAAGWQLPTGVTIVEGSGTDAETGLPLRITLERDPVEMVLIPPGVFLEGIDGRDPQAAPQHSVLLETPYYIDIVEVTVARHDAFREFFRKSEGRRMDPAANHDGNPENPAVGIKFLDAKFYAKWTGKELPTEAQWERAARGSQGFSYPWGNGRPIWHQPRQPGQLDPVATFAGDVSPHGVYDMAGNAREWCLDLYSADIYRKDVAAGGSTVRNPTGPKTYQGPKLQVVKGSKITWTVWQRAGQPQTEAAPDLGFRCVLNITAAAKDSGKPAPKATPKAKEKKNKSDAF